jgi:hypothetical protein
VMLLCGLTPVEKGLKQAAIRCDLAPKGHTSIYQGFAYMQGVTAIRWLIARVDQCSRNVNSSGKSCLGERHSSERFLDHV